MGVNSFLLGSGCKKVWFPKQTDGSGRGKVGRRSPPSLLGDRQKQVLSEFSHKLNNPHEESEIDRGHKSVTILGIE